MTEDIQVVAFKIDNEEYAIDIKGVQEIIRVSPITRVPYSSSYMSGVINLRGMVIPVMDIRKRFGSSERTYDETSRIIITRWNELLVGMLVDGVTEVIRLRVKDIEHPSSFSTNFTSDAFSGMGKIGNRVLMIINMNNVIEIKNDIDGC